MVKIYEGGGERWKEENVHGDEMNRTSASKLLAKIESSWSMVEKWFKGLEM